MSQIQATLITIGDEILIGQTIDTNSAFMAQRLNEIGVHVYEIISISDSANHIIQALDTALASSDIVLITGGLGPTKDDITKETLAKYFGSKLVLHQDILEEIEAYFKKRNRPMLESVKSLAMLPEKCEVIRNLKGTAAAMWFQQKEKAIISMPGVPYEMRDFMTRIIIPRLVEQFNTPTILHKRILCAGLGESIIAEKIKAIENSLPEHIKLAYLPTLGIVKLRLSARGTDVATLQEENNTFAQQIKNILYPKYAFGEDDAILEQTVGELLLEKNAKLGIAESCTGGLIARKITSISGSSRYFDGGVVAYSNRLKKQLLGVKAETLDREGAVSEATVCEMAKGTIEHLGVDYSIAVSGIAGPTGGTPEKPVGTIWAAVANKERVVAKKFQLARNRDLNVKVTTTLAVNLLRLLILDIV